MDPRDPFSEEAYRYAAECRRLARLARKPTPPDSTTTVAYLRLLAWLSDVQQHFGTHKQPEFSRASSPSRR